MAASVASVTTIGTPHQGTVLVDTILAGGGEHLLAGLWPFLDMDGFLTLTTGKRQAFNEVAQEWEATNPVLYQTYAGSQALENIMLLMQGSYQFIFEQAGENDGLVPVSSQLWTNELVAADGTVKQIANGRFPSRLIILMNLAGGICKSCPAVVGGTSI